MSRSHAEADSKSHKGGSGCGEGRAGNERLRRCVRDTLAFRDANAKTEPLVPDRGTRPDGFQSGFVMSSSGSPSSVAPGCAALAAAPASGIPASPSCTM